LLAASLELLKTDEEIAAAQRAIQQLQSQLGDFNTDQDRVRSNLMALEKVAQGGAAEKLVQQYVDQLAKAENDIIQTRRKVAELEESVRILRKKAQRSKQTVARLARGESFNLQGKDAPVESVRVESKSRAYNQSYANNDDDDDYAANDDVDDVFGRGEAQVASYGNQINAPAFAFNAAPQSQVMYQQKMPPQQQVQMRK